jgi:hypothetical protein
LPSRYSKIYAIDSRKRPVEFAKIFGKDHDLPIITTFHLSILGQLPPLLVKFVREIASKIARGDRKSRVTLSIFGFILSTGYRIPSMGRRY